MSAILGLSGELKVDSDISEKDKEYKGKISQEIEKEEKYIELYRYQMLMNEKIDHRDWSETKKYFTIVSLLVLSGMLEDMFGLQYVSDIWLALTVVVISISVITVTILNRRDRNQFYAVATEYLEEWGIDRLILTTRLKDCILQEFSHIKKSNVLKNINREIGNCNVYQLTESIGHPEDLSNELTFDHYTLYEKDGRYYQVAWDTTLYIKESPVFIFEIVAN